MQNVTSSSGPAATASRTLRPGARKHRLAVAAALLAFAGAAWPALAQNYVTQYNAATGPVGLALDSIGGVTYLYVADEANGNVLKINPATGATVATFGTGSQGSNAGQFGRPYGIAVDPTSHDLYVTERLNGRVQRINSTTGASVMMWGINDAAFNSAGQNVNPANPTSPQGHFQEPIGVAADAAGNVYVVDHGNNRVQKFLVHQVSGTWTADNVAMWGTTGAGNGQFDHPYGAALDSSGALWVADGLNGRVQKFDASGNYLGSAGAKGTAAGQFVIATWVNFAGGAMYVTSTNSDPQASGAADINNQWVSKFTPSGNAATFVSRFGGTYGSNPGELRLPFDVVVDAASKAYVTDYYNSRVQVFDLTTAPGGTPSGGSTSGSGGTGTGTTSTGGTGSGTGTTSTGGTGTGTGSTSTGGTTSGGTTSGSGSGSGTGTTSTSGTGTGTGSTAGVQVVSVTAPANGTYRAGSALVFTVTFSAPVTVTAHGEDDDSAAAASDDGDRAEKKDRGSDKHSGGDDDNEHSTTSTGSTSGGTTSGTGSTVTATTSTATFSDEEDGVVPSIGWTAVAAAGQTGDSGRAQYVSGSGTTTLTFKYQVHGNDSAPQGITLAAAITPTGSITDAAGHALTAAQLALPWATNPLPQVILVRANESNPGDDHRSGTPASGSTTGGTTSGSSGSTTSTGTTTGTTSAKLDPKAAKLVNLSSRLHIKSGDPARAVAVGFVVSGSATQPVLIRAVGPGLKSFGVSDALAALSLSIQDSTGKLVATNSDWSGDAQVSLTALQVGAFSLTAGSGDAAVVLSLKPGAYTATIGTTKGEGEALIEVYDAASASTALQQLVNISTRGYVDADGNVIAGFVVRGTAPKRVLVRAVGPGLAAFGVSSPLADPALAVRDASGALVAQNNDWGTPQSLDTAHPAAAAADITAADTAAGAFPLAAGSKDAAVVVTLNPGAYTTVVTGANHASGAVLVEVYELSQ